MRSASYDTRHHGLPRWTLAAAAPVVLAVGFVAGVALAVYWPASEAESPVVTSPPTAVPPVTGTSPAVLTPSPPLPPSPTDDGQLAAADGPRASHRSGPLPLPIDEPTQFASPGMLDPWVEQSRPEAKTLVEARTALAAEYNLFHVNGRKAFQIDYQLARDANHNMVLIGIVKIADYPEWARAVRETPSLLENWLRAAAERAKPAALKEKFTLTWTIFEVVNDPPFGFASKEVSPLPRGGGYLVTRPLAAVTNVERSTVTIATVDDPTRPVTATEAPWAAYGPVLRFDPSDLYRPVKP